MLSKSQVDLAFYPRWDGKTNTIPVMLDGLGIKAGMVWFAGKTVWPMSERAVYIGHGTI